MAAIGRGGVRNPWTQPTYGYYNTQFEQSLTEQDTAGQLTMMRMTLNPESAPPLHFHTREDEFWTVVSGRVRFWLGGSTLESCAVQEAEPGGFVFGPRNVPHTFQTITETAEVLIGNTPGALEGYFTGVGAADARHDDANTDVLGDYGVFFIGPAPVWSEWNR
ncbi:MULTISPECIES: cupin domain-containing protein [Nocardia]|uniref:cupin domain-containing protein n=1 Tax=Nocardia TaxID=1817 RepID=UPI001895C5C6|nr:MULTISPECIES: cupin domain-containing protein [Nocardia]MBF6352509.1 cupin domain-containing protein [Nocardia flavorosea]